VSTDGLHAKNVAGGGSGGKKTTFEEGGAEPDTTGGEGKKVQWGKLAVKMLTKAGGSMPVEALTRKLLKKGGSGGGDAGEVRTALGACPSLVVGDSLATLK
jgi:hypothetical protein